MTTTLARWRGAMLPPFDWSAGMLPLFPPEIRVEQVIKDGLYHVRAELPGVAPKDIDVTVINGMLKLHAERSEEQHDKSHSEFHYGRLVRTVVLPMGVQEDTGTASYTNGILEVTFKMGEPREPGRQIAVETPKEEVTAATT